MTLLQRVSQDLLDVETCDIHWKLKILNFNLVYHMLGLVLRWLQDSHANEGHFSPEFIAMLRL